MAQNYQSVGSMLTIPAPANVSSGGVVIVGNIAGVAQGDALSGASVDIAVTGIWRLPKVGANTFAVGASVYWDGTAKLATSVTSGNTKIGTAVEVAGSGGVDVAVRLVSF